MKCGKLTTTFDFLLEASTSFDEFELLIILSFDCVAQHIFLPRNLSISDAWASQLDMVSALVHAEPVKLLHCAKAHC